jgi:hypothetical protein
MILVSITARAWPAPITIVDNGQPSNRVDIVFLGDGYTQSDIDAGTYDRHIQDYLDHMFASPTLWDDPFPRYKNFFNAHKIDVVSNESGADIPSQNISVDTALDATYESSGVERRLTVNIARANTIRNQQLAGTGITADMQLVTVNHTKYGGSGGSWAVYAGGSSSAHEIALHELAHSFSDLADEYVSFTGPYPHPEPHQRNITKDPTGAKWDYWLGFDDPRGSSLDIGVFEGAAYYPTGIYRPSRDSKMRSLNEPFDAVSREAFIHDIYQLVNPLDGWMDDSAPLTDATLWVDVVDPRVIKAKWYVDDALVEGANSESFELAEFGFGPGTYEVRAHAYDDVIDHAFGGGMLDLVRTQFDLLQHDIFWTLTITEEGLAGDYNHNGIVDAADYVVWRATQGQSAVPSGSGADGDGSGTIDIGDYHFWRERFGNEASTASLAAGAAVPESQSAFLALVAGAFAIASRRGRGRTTRIATRIAARRDQPKSGRNVGGRVPL